MPKKKPEDWTTEEAIKRLFPPAVVKEVKREIGPKQEPKSTSTPHDKG